MQEIPILGVSVWPFLKYGILFGFLLYIIFAVVVVRQVKLMTKTLELGHEGVIKALSLIHLIAAVLIFFFTAAIL